MTDQECQTTVQKINFMSICDMAESNSNKIAIDRYHIEMMGDLAGASFLTQLRYWFSPTTKSTIKGSTRAGIKKEGLLWVAKRDTDWWDECYVSFKQVRRIKKKLVKMGLIKIKCWKFDGERMTHYHLDLQKYADMYHQFRVMNAEKESDEQKKADANRKHRREMSQRDSSKCPKGTDPAVPKGQTYNISSSHLTSSFHFKKHVQNALQNQNVKELLSELRGKALKDFKSLEADRKDAYRVLMTLPPSAQGGESFNAVQALKIANTYMPEEIYDAIKVLEGKLRAGNTIKKSTGAYVTWILEKGLKPESENKALNKEFWNSIKEVYKGIGIEEHQECLEIDDITAFYFDMDHESFKINLLNVLKSA